MSNTDRNIIKSLLTVPEKLIKEELNSNNYCDKVWILDLPYKLCTLISQIDSNEVVVGFKDNNGIFKKKNVKKQLTQSVSSNHYVDDMCNLSELNEASVIACLKARYINANLIHTYSGLFCVFINPWTSSVSKIYTKDVKDFYKNEFKVEKILPPHIYYVAMSAYDGILSGNKNQSILITGESGAGKTENTKKIIEYIIEASDSSSSKCNKMQNDLINSGIVLEAFANAQTIHNCNSSRVGKFIKLDFDKNGKLNNAKINCYLLEKSRVVFQNLGDRNFHIFYQLLSDGVDKKRKMSLGLKKPPNEYAFLSHGKIKNDANLNDKEDAQSTINALLMLNFTEEDISQIFEVLSIILLMGEIKFGERKGLDISFVESMEYVKEVCRLSQIDSSKFVDALTQPTIKIGDKLIRKNQNLKKTLSSVLGLSKLIYDKLFNWVVDRCNEILLNNDSNNYSSSFIGVLDMAGFEIMNINSFEQFCINYTNERLQQFFNHFMFIKEQSEYLNEQIEWNEINFGVDLQPSIEMIEAPMGLLTLLQEECVVPNGNDISMLEKLTKTLDGEIFQKARQSVKNNNNSHFTIKHYAGIVGYNIEGWVEKNRDTVDNNVLEIMGTSNHSLLKIFFKNINNANNNTNKNSRTSTTVTSLYRESLHNLIEVLHSTNANFIRCIVPNYEKRAFLMNETLVLNQLRCNGVLEGIRICQRGYPNRMSFNDFINRYKCLLNYNSKEIQNSLRRQVGSKNRDAAVILCNYIPIDKEGYQIGKTKIFLKIGVVSQLENLRKKYLFDCTSNFQGICRWYIEQKILKYKYNKWDAILTIQDNVKQYIYTNQWDWWKIFLKVKQIIPIKQNEKKIVDLINQNKQLLKELEEMKILLSEVEKEMELLKRELSILQKDLETKDDTYNELKIEFTNSEKLLCFMEKRFDEQQSTLSKMQSVLKQNERSLEKLKQEKELLEKEICQLKESYHTEQTLRQNFESEYEEYYNKYETLEKKHSQLLENSKNYIECLHSMEAKLDEQKDLSQKQNNKIVDLQNTIVELNDNINKLDSILNSERHLKRKIEDLKDDMEEKLEDLRDKLERSKGREETLKNQCIEKDRKIEKLENKIDQKSEYMDECINELKKMHKETQQEMKNQLDEYRRKCSKLEQDNRTLKIRVADVDDINEKSIIEDTDSYSSYKSNSRLGSRQPSLQSISYQSSTSNMTSSRYSTRSSLLRRRETEPDIFMAASMVSNENLSTYGSLNRSPSFNSSRYTSNDMGKEKKICNLEKQIQNLNQENQLAKRELEVYKTNLVDMERRNSSLKNQINAMTIENNNLNNKIERQEDEILMYEERLKKYQKEANIWKQKYEEMVDESRKELLMHRKKSEEKLKEICFEYSKKLHSYSTSDRNKIKIQEELDETKALLDSTKAQLYEVKKHSKSQSILGDNWENKYRSCMTEIESLRDENASLKNKVRRQYKEIELLTQQNEIKEECAMFEKKVDSFQERVPS
uniref:Myosin motor domain-containing protein n=1 Tax=Strongyloides papillosus TaxID=174720 RepID=A0A0N5CDU2_STREA